LIDFRNSFTDTLTSGFTIKTLQC